MGRGTASMDSGCCGDRVWPPPPPPPPAPPLPPSIIGCCEGGGTAGFFTSVASPTLSLLCRPLTGESRDDWSDSSAPNIFLHSGFCTRSLMLEHFNDSEKKKRWRKALEKEKKHTHSQTRFKIVTPPPPPPPPPKSLSGMCAPQCFITKGRRDAHIYAHSCMHTHNTHVHTCAHTQCHTHICTHYTHTHTHTHIHTQCLSHTCTHYTHAHVRAHTHMLAHMCAHTHTHTHTHTNTQHNIKTTHHGHSRSLCFLWLLLLGSEMQTTWHEMFFCKTTHLNLFSLMGRPRGGLCSLAWKNVNIRLVSQEACPLSWTVLFQIRIGMLQAESHYYCYNNTVPQAKSNNDT